jgi:hypothetical protein
VDDCRAKATGSARRTPWTTWAPAAVAAQSTSRRALVFALPESQNSSQNPVFSQVNDFETF